MRPSRKFVDDQEESSPPLDVEPDAGATGYAWLLRRQDLSLYLLACVCIALLIRATITLFVVRAVALGLGESGVGFFYAAVAVGSIAGSVVAGARAQHLAPLYAVAVAIALCAIALTLFGSSGAVAVAFAALVIAGFATDFYEVVGLTYFQNAIPDALYARFLSVFFLALSAGGLVGALGGPALERMLGVGTSLLVLAVPSVVLALVLGSVSRYWRGVGRVRGT